MDSLPSTETSEFNDIADSLLGIHTYSRIPFRFLDLPGELRNSVYEYLYHDGWQTMSLVNHQIRAEMLSKKFNDHHSYVTLTAHYRQRIEPWTDNWMSGIAKYFRFVEIFGYHCLNSRYGTTARWCTCDESMTVDLKTSTLTLISKHLTRPDCAPDEVVASDVEAVVKGFEKVDGWRQLTPEGYLQMFKAATKQQSMIGLELSMSGHALM